MFRFEIGATILVKRFNDTEYEPQEVKILAKAPNTIKVLTLTDGWFGVDKIRILTSDKWYSVGRIKEV